MNLRQMTGWGKSDSAAEKQPDAGEAKMCLMALLEGAADAVPRIDPKSHGQFRAMIARMAKDIPAHLENVDQKALVETLLHEFQIYRSGVEIALRDRQKSWQGLTAKLVRELLNALEVNADSPTALPLKEGIEPLSTAEEIREYRGLLEGFLELRAASTEAAKLSPLKVADTSTENDNAAGLMGGGAAVEHLRKVMERGDTGYVVIFKLSCLEMVSQRFGPAAVEDCLMAVSSYLTASLNGDDAIFHWSDSSLVAILLYRPNEHILNAELNRIASKNENISVNTGGRSIMLRIPFSFEVTPISRFKSADDLYKLWLQSSKKR
ncbi:MAG: diguanylate cyclase [Terracidiphilus sp.]|jgi:GGDEF domain-containing protein